MTIMTNVVGEVKDFLDKSLCVRRNMDIKLINISALARMMKLYYPEEIQLFEDHFAKDLLNQPIKFIMSLMHFKGILVNGG